MNHLHTIHLLAQLDEPTLRQLPCSYPRPEEFDFLIGSATESGPQIKFYKETKDLYYLFIRDVAKRSAYLSVQYGSTNFMTCQGIYHLIRKLALDSNYTSILQNRDNLNFMFTNVENIVRDTLDSINK